VRSRRLLTNKTHADVRFILFSHVIHYQVRIILVNYRYFISGGPEKYLFNIKELLETNGHSVIPFSVQSKDNHASEYEGFFLKPVSKANETYFKEYNKFNPVTLWRGFTRMFYSFEARRKLDKLIKAVKPDLIYVLHYQNKISASIFDAAKKNRIPVVHRVSDFGLICSNALFYRPRQKDICERCLGGSRLNAVVNKCVHDSYIYSSVKAGSLAFQKAIGTTGKIQAFVVPSRFTRDKLIEYGIPGSKLVHIPTFFNFRSNDQRSETEYRPFALYVGRIEPEKGLMTLVRAFENTGFNLKIIGFSSSGFEEQVKDYLRNKQHHVEFLGKKSFEGIKPYLNTCAFTIVPSECYDNFPNSVLESFAFRKCVVATNTGSLKEVVLNRETGLLFDLKNVADLRNKIEYLFANTELCREMGENAFRRLQNEYSAEKHYCSLINLFGQVVAQHKHVLN